MASHRKRAKSPALMGSHQRCWIWGRNAVVETLRAGRWPILELRLSTELDPQELDQALQLADRQSVEVVQEAPEEIARICRSEEHQGFAAKLPPFPYFDPQEALKSARSPACFVILDSIHDPFNFGAILRNADAFGVDAVFVGKVGQSAVTSAVVRASAGAINHVRLAQVDDLAMWIETLKQADVAIVGTSPKSKTDVADHDFRKSTAVILGNEGFGVRPELSRQCDVLVGIRQHGRVGSLNAAVSAGILFYEISRQRAASR